MNKIIPFVKIITLNEQFEEIKKIALDDTLKLEDEYTIKGDLIIRGCYQKEEREEAFSYPIPVEIAIDDKYDTSKCKINIDDFYYEIINEQDIRVKIDLILDDLYYKEQEIKKEEIKVEDTRDRDIEVFKEELDELEEFIIEPEKVENNEINNVIINNNEFQESIKQPIVNTEIKQELKRPIIDNEVTLDNKMEDLFKENNNEVKEYSVYRVYTITEGETLEFILDKYKVTREDLMPINDLENIKPGVKLIIPSIDE